MPSRISEDRIVELVGAAFEAASTSALEATAAAELLYQTLKMARRHGLQVSALVACVPGDVGEPRLRGWLRRRPTVETLAGLAAVRRCMPLAVWSCDGPPTAKGRPRKGMV